MSTKILIETKTNIEEALNHKTDKVPIYSVNCNNIFDNGMIVLDKYTNIMIQMYYKDGVFINTIFSFLLKLKSEGASLYYKQLHTKLLNRVKVFFKAHNINNIYLYDYDPVIKEYLDVECFNYRIFKDVDSLLDEIVKYY